MPVRALVVGSLVMDLSFRVPKRPEPGEVILADSFGTYRGGKGFNQAVALARLGAQVAMIGAVGTDAFGREFIDTLRATGIDATRMLQLQDAPTSVAVPLVTPDGDVGFVHAQGANALLPVTAVLDPPACDILFLQGEVPPETSLAAAEAVKATGGTIFLNPAPVHHITPALLAIADIICPNEVEGLALLGDGRPAQQSPRAIAERLARDGKTVVITLGARGAAYFRDGIFGMIAPPTIDAIDATGAGDSFCAALGLALIEGQSLEEAVRFACAAGAHAATVRGAEPGLPTRQQVADLLARGG
jgi:ribokinase